MLMLAFIGRKWCIENEYSSAPGLTPGSEVIVDRLSISGFRYLPSVKVSVHVVRALSCAVGVGSALLGAEE